MFNWQNEWRCRLPFSNMKYSWPFDNHRVQFAMQTLLWYVLQRPVPIVVIVYAKMICTLHNITPRTSIEAEAHIVFATYPRRHLHLHNSLWILREINRKRISNEKLSNCFPFNCTSALQNSGTERKKFDQIISTQKKINEIIDDVL